MKIIYFLFFFLFLLTVQAQDLVYKPINPAFGGDTFNYQWLLNSADSQNLYKDPTTANQTQKTELQRFADNLNSQLLNQLSSSLFGSQVGTDSSSGITEGAYTFGSLSVDIHNSSEGLVVNILDVNTGEQTQIIIP